MRLVQFTAKNVFRRPMRSALTVAGVAGGVAAVVALVGIAGSFERALTAVFERRGVDLLVSSAGGLQKTSSVLDESLCGQIAALPLARDVSPGLVDVYSFAEHDLFGVVARGVPPESFLIRDLEVLSGRRLAEGDVRCVMLGKTLAANLGKQPGDKLDVAAREEFEVVGVYESFSPLENGWLIMPLAELQRMMDRQGKVMVISVVARQPDEETILALRDEIAAMASNLEVLPARSFVGSMVEIRLARAMAWMTSALALFVGAISMLNTMLAAVHERTRELAVLRAVGWRKTSVLRLVLIEAVLLALGSAALGTLLGLGAVHLLSLFPTAGRLVVGDIGWDVIAQGFAVAVVLGVLGGLYPACRAARQVPTEGLRHD